MGMDGLFRPSQLNGYLDTVGHRNGADMAKDALSQTYGVSPHRKVEHVGKERHDDEDSRPKDHPTPQRPETGIEEDLITLLASEYGILLDPSVVYRFVYDEASDTILLKNSAAQEILLTLTPQAFIRLTEHIAQSEGVMTDRSA